MEAIYVGLICGLSILAMTIGLMKFFFEKYKRDIKANPNPLFRIRNKILGIVKHLPQSMLQKEFFITGINGEGKHTLADIIRMPELVNFLRPKDLALFPEILRNRRTKDIAGYPEKRLCV